MIYCEGKNTEPAYFESFAAAFGNNLVEVDALGGIGVPLTIVQKAVAEKRLASRKKVRSGFETLDQYWAVFDRDSHPNIPQAFDMARANGIKVAYSNPCFELWAILHLKDYDRPTSTVEAISELKKILPGYDPDSGKKLTFSTLLPGYGAACQRARTGIKRREQEGSPQATPYTDVVELTELIVENGKPTLVKKVR